MSDIVVRKDGEKWVAFYNDRRISASPCKACVINVLMAVTKNSGKYKSVSVMNEQNQVERIIMIGAG